MMKELIVGEILTQLAAANAQLTEIARAIEQNCESMRDVIDVVLAEEEDEADLSPEDEATESVLHELFQSLPPGTQVIAVDPDDFLDFIRKNNFDVSED
ncbi:hypothetical protein [Alicyclobacillus shizuokensis]|uniref:hypothetical protein n=1 Tax=Alicyclobacillus shizuokensis TaxID=392014 RepID=UPI00082D435A|nr:hypothetical protein [Alicyclobacillus shizuokensis]